MKNRSVPVDVVLPHVMYQNLADAIAWLSKTFGFQEHCRSGDPLSGAQMYLGKAYLNPEKWGAKLANLGGKRD
jgi:uncharacterized glyoxalase superfamily protein PhnB